MIRAGRLLVGSAIALATASACAQFQDVGFSDDLGQGSGERDPAASDAVNASDASESESDPATSDGGGRASDASVLGCPPSATACGTSCVDLTRDPANCGRCGRACAPCDRGMCASTTIVSSSLDPALAMPNRILVDANYIYWTVAHGVRRANKDGTATTALGSSYDGAIDGALVMDAAALYWAHATGRDSGSLYGSEKLGLGETLLLDLPSRPFGLAVDQGGGSLMIGTRAQSNDPSEAPAVVFSTSLSQPSLQALGTAAAKQLGGIAMDATDVYATASDTGALLAFSRASGAAHVVASGFANPIEVVLDGASAYVIDAGVDRGAIPGAVVRVALDGSGAKTILAGNLEHPYAIAVDPEAIYFTTSGNSLVEGSIEQGTVMRVPKLGGTVQPIAVDQPAPRGVAVDDQFVYWCNFGTEANFGSVQRSPREGSPSTGAKIGRRAVRFRDDGRPRRAKP